jgi:hypothetical protein
MRLMEWKPFDDSKWHRWFAWRPVWVGNELVWWEELERSVIHHHRFKVAPTRNYRRPV